MTTEDACLITGTVAHYVSGNYASKTTASSIESDWFDEGGARPTNARKAHVLY